MDRVYQIHNVMEHLEAYCNCRFICSGDTEKEIQEGIREYEEKMKNLKPIIGIGERVRPKSYIDMTNLGVGIMYRENFGKVIATYQNYDDTFGCVVLCDNGKLFKAHESEWEKVV